jgi:hypothetical protein
MPQIAKPTAMPNATSNVYNSSPLSQYLVHTIFKMFRKPPQKQKDKKHSTIISKYKTSYVKYVKTSYVISYHQNTVLQVSIVVLAFRVNFHRRVTVICSILKHKSRISSDLWNAHVTKYTFLIRPQLRLFVTMCNRTRVLVWHI